MTNIKTFRQLSIDDTLYLVHEKYNRVLLCGTVMTEKLQDSVTLEVTIYDEIYTLHDMLYCFEIVNLDEHKRTIIVNGNKVTLYSDYQQALNYVNEQQTTHYLTELRSIDAKIRQLRIELSDKHTIHNSLTNALNELNESFINLTQTITNDQTKEHKGE